MIYRCIAEIGLFVLSCLLISESYVLTLNRRKQNVCYFGAGILAALAALHVGKLFP